MELDDKVTQLEDEIKILKNEIQAVLLDLRESCLDMENPVGRQLQPLPEQHIVVSASAPQASSPSQPQPADRELPRAVPEDRTVSEPAATDEPAKKSEPARETAPAPAPQPHHGNERKTARDPEPVAQPEPAPEPESVAAEDEAREEVTRAWRPMTELSFDSGNGKNGDGHTGGQIDLATIARLADWVADVVERLGSERAEAILDISEMVGFVDPELKEVLAKFIRPSPGEKEGKVTTRDYLVSLKELDRIIRKATRFEIALLTILCQGNDSG